MVVHYEDHAERLVIHVDATRRDAWKKEPYFSQIKNWARRAAERQGQVVIWQGLDAIVVLPDREKPMGRVRSDQLIITIEKRTPFGTELDVEIMDRDDPRLAGRRLPPA
jgi:hypothetical protein